MFFLFCIFWVYILYISYFFSLSKLMLMFSVSLLGVNFCFDFID